MVRAQFRSAILVAFAIVNSRFTGDVFGDTQFGDTQCRHCS
jgi:hypothetical protein